MIFYNFSKSVVSFFYYIYAYSAVFTAVYIYKTHFHIQNMDEETIKRIENMIKEAVQDMFDRNYCPHGSECRFCREDGL